MLENAMSYGAFEEHPTLNDLTERAKLVGIDVRFNPATGSLFIVDTTKDSTEYASVVVQVDMLELMKMVYVDRAVPR